MVGRWAVGHGYVVVRGVSENCLIDVILFSSYHIVGFEDETFMRDQKRFYMCRRGSSLIDGGKKFDVRRDKGQVLKILGQ